MKKKTKDLPEIPGIEHGPNDLSDRLEYEELTRGIIRIDDSIDEFNTTDYMRKIAYVVNRGIKNIKFFITSPGGSAYHALALYDRLLSLKNVGVKTEAYVEGMAASAASMIVLQGIQKRYATANSRFLIHEVRRFVMFTQERATELAEQSKEMNILTDVVFGILSKRTKMSKKQIYDLISRKEVWLSAGEARKIGLIDAIVS